MDINFSRTCRVCLEKFNSNYEFIYVKDKLINDFLTIANILMECSSVLVLENDELPKKICMKCFDMLKISYKFKKLCENSNEVLRLQLLSKKISQVKNNENNVDLKFELNENLSEKSFDNFGTNNYSQDNETICNKNDDQYFEKDVKSIQSDNDVDEWPLDLKTDVKFEEDSNIKLDKKKRKKRISTNPNIKRRPNTKNDGVSVCSYCKTRFFSSYLKNQHEDIFHKENNPNKYLFFEDEKLYCFICNATSETKELYEEHKQKHGNDKKYFCLECDTNYESLVNLKEHSYKHRDKAYFDANTRCTICSKPMSRLRELDRHMLLHSGTKTHLCTICGQSFLHALSLQLHVRRHTGEKPFKCDVCDARFITVTFLNHHKVIHTGERKYTCKICKKSFKQRSALRSHRFTMHKDSIDVNWATKNQCKLCDKSFLVPYKLREHTLVEHQGYKLVCQYCNKQYCSSGSLRKHMKKVHSNMPYQPKVEKNLELF